MFKKNVLLNKVTDIQKFIRTASSFAEDIDLVKDRYVIDGKSALGVHTLDLSKPITVVIHTDDEAVAKRFFDELKDIIVEE